MINLIIFSKDRAFQLEGLLRSIKLNCDIFDWIYVLFNCSERDFHVEYTKLSGVMWGGGMGWFNEGNYEEDNGTVTSFKSRLDECFNDMQYTCFMVDDMICYRKIKMPITDSFEGIFSLRLGKNIRHSIHQKYPFSLDGHIYQTEYIKGLIEPLQFQNPNKLEVGLQRYVREAPNVSYFPESCCVSIPANKVSDTSSCSAGVKYPYQTKMLNDLFLQGGRMDFESMDFTGIDNVHKEIEFKFK